MLTALQVWILKRLGRGRWPAEKACPYTHKSKLAVQLGQGFFEEIAGKIVIDFGCGEGAEAVEMAQRGAKRVIGIDIREDVVRIARQKARAAKVEDRCTFSQSATEPADVIVSLDAFEHFADPAAVLETMASLLRPGGKVYASFGPTWYHPLGGHLFSIFPWAHLIFSEQALLAWRSTFKNDGATRFSEVAGGLNQMTIKRFIRLVEASPLRFASFELAPIRKLRLLHNRLTREFTTSAVRCQLVKR
jgi:SAM-dependent methyltransferase